MEKGLRDCCRSMRIGKILIKRDPNTKVARVKWLLVGHVTASHVILYTYRYIMPSFHQMLIKGRYCYSILFLVRLCSMYIA